MNHKTPKGYTIIEFIIIIAIVGILMSVLVPHLDLVWQRAAQAKARSNLGQVRTAVNLYFSDTDGTWPLAGLPEGAAHFADGFSLTGNLVPRYIPKVPIPKLVDRLNSFNGISQSYDSEAKRLMAMTPPRDAAIIHGSPSYIPILNTPYVFDNMDGQLFYSNGNYDYHGEYFYTW